MPCPSVGLRAKMAVKYRGTAWAAGAATLGAADRIPFANESIARAENEVQDNSIWGQSGFRAHSIHDGYRIDGPLVTEGDYEFLLTLVALHMGTAGTPDTISGGEAYEHTLTWNPTLCAIDGTVGVDRGDDASDRYATYVYDAVKVIAFQMNMDNKVQFTFTLKGRAEATGQDPSAWTFPTGIDGARDAHLILRSQSTWKFNLQSAAALDTPDEVSRPATAQVSSNRLLDGELVQSSGIDGVVDEPIETDFNNGTVQVEFNVYTKALHDFFIARRNDKALVKGSVAFDAGTLYTLGGSGDTYNMGLEFPSLKVRSVSPNIAAPGRIPLSVEFEMSEVSTGDAISGMVFDGPYRFTMRNSRSADPLA